MDRSELVCNLVLNQIADDYENVDQCILRDVEALGAKLGLTIERSEVVDALSRLIEDGLAKAYLLSSRKPFTTELDGMPPLEVIEEDFRTYFYITPKGREVHRSDEFEWPFDDEGNAR
jgi:hypothetical protein